MTKQSTEALIAEAQTCVTDEYITPDTPFEEALIRRLAAALEAATVRPMFRCEADLTCTREAQKPRCGPSDLIVCPTHRQELLEAAEQRAEDAEGEMEGMVDLDSEFIHRLETQRDQLAAVVEKVREEVEAADGVDVTSQNLIPVLATAPQEVLRERDAALLEGLAVDLDNRGDEPGNPYSYDPWEDDSVDPTNLDEVVDAAVDEGWAMGEYRGRRDAVLAIREKAGQKRPVELSATKWTSDEAL